MSIFKFIYLLCGISLLIFIFNKIDIALFLNELNKLGFSFFLVLLIYCVGFILDSYSWRLCIKSLISKEIKLYEIFKIRLIGEAFNYIILQVGGEPIKAFLLKKNFKIKYKTSIGSLILAKTIILFALIIFCFIGLLSIFYTNKFGHYYEIVSLIDIFFFISTIGTVVYFFYNVKRFFRKVN